MLGRHYHPPDETVHRGERRLAAQLRACGSRYQQDDCESSGARGSA
jgi:hypothetical protein